MSAFDVWLWLKLDDIRECIGVLTGVALLAAAIVAIFTAASSERLYGTPPKQDWRLVRRIVLAWRLVRRIVLACCISIPACCAAPSTKQAAAIYVVPQLVESRVFTNDIPQLYGMAVDALKEKLAGEVAK